MPETDSANEPSSGPAVELIVEGGKLDEAEEDVCPEVSLLEAWRRAWKQQLTITAFIL